ncbi:hypothetical protein GOBAR_DD01094 [Gossypium barbadense]|nr:hypothetical protein GOBAR_DD01094 [Gossypium barbadense]
MGLQLLVGKGASPGRGLGRYLQGRTEERKKSVEESIEETLGNMHINAIHELGNEERSWLDIRPYEPGSVLDNWTAEEIPKVFRTVSDSCTSEDAVGRNEAT